MNIGEAIIKKEFLSIRCAVPECDEDTAVTNFTIPQHEDGTYAKCVRYAPFANVSDFANSSIGRCSPHYFDTSTVIECESYVYLEEHSIVKEVSSFYCTFNRRVLIED